MEPPREFPNWAEIYRNDGVEKLPWYCPTLDPDLDAALTGYGIMGGRVLDLCTGPGTQALALAERGFTVTASDLSIFGDSVSTCGWSCMSSCFKSIRAAARRACAQWAGGASFAQPRAPSDRSP